MICPDCGKLRHEGPCKACEACGWPVEASETLCHECSLEMAMMYPATGWDMEEGEDVRCH